MVVEKHGDSWKNMQQLPKPLCAFLSKQLRPCLYVIHNFRFQFKIVIGGGKYAAIKILFVYVFCQEKINQLKASKL